jgi:hypothetical protein
MIILKMARSIPSETANERPHRLLRQQQHVFRKPRFTQLHKKELQRLHISLALFPAKGLLIISQRTRISTLSAHFSYVGLPHEQTSQFYIGMTATCFQFQLWRRPVL